VANIRTDDLHDEDSTLRMLSRTTAARSRSRDAWRTRAP